ncbi:hypothetical protein [Archangium violaceum]|uniref:hypothetical protein n=1 Tax=Archangium violaceum TaxID=83451 RepID=UPI0037BEEC00
MLLAGLATFSLGCATGLPESEKVLTGTTAGTLAAANGMTSNGLATNGLATNGLATNGLATNGLATNGLATNGLSSASFSTWFNSNPAGYSDMVMKYVVACAYSEGQSLSYSDGVTTFTWYGRLGLAPGWASGSPATVSEQQLISACLAVHVNKFGAHVDISVRGQNALGTSIPVTTTESSTFSEREAAFFGNLFTGEGIYACNDRGTLTPSESSLRACGLSSQNSGTSIECPPIQHTGQCSTLCTFDKLKGYYTSCTLNRKSFLALTTRLKPSDIYKCGDGTCQISESCDSTKTLTGTAYNNCNADCGVCGL